MQGMVMGVLLTVLLLSATMVYANNRVTREITYGVNVMLNGEMVQFDYDTRPFVMDGRTFLPLRTLAELVGLPVDFDPATNTAIVGSRYAAGTRRPLVQAAPHFDNGGTSGHLTRTSVAMVNSVTMAGMSYQNALRFTDYDGAGWGRSDGGRRFTLHNLNGQFRMLTGYVGRVDGTAMSGATIRFIGDGQLLVEYELRATDLPTPISVFVEGINQLSIEMVFPSRSGSTVTRYALIGYLE